MMQITALHKTEYDFFPTIEMFSRLSFLDAP